VSRIEIEAMTPETLGTGVHSPYDWREFEADKAHAVRMYKDQDISVVVWNLEPGQENSAHQHPESAHTFIVLTGQGEYHHGSEDAVPIKAGDYIIIPRLTMHGIRNTGTERLSYAAVTSQGPNGYSRG
jgi:quercetin dioxygenase-like cupin family protein